MENPVAHPPLRILCLEDNVDDQRLLEATLKSEGFHSHFVHVTTRKAFEAALKKSRFDVIISDYALPSYSGMAALAVARQLQSDTPFVLVSGTIGEERAVEGVKSGADDYVLKDNLERLGPVVRRALNEARERARRRQAEEALRLQSEQLRALTARIQSSREEERIQISRELHDELGEALTGLKLGLNWIRNRLGAPDGANSRDQVFGKINELGNLADTTANRVRRLCAELRPNVLDDLGLVAAMHWQVNEFQNRTRIRCSARFPESLPVSGDKATAIFRIFQEILTNVARHARATKVLIVLKRGAQGLVLRVADDGRGILDAEITSSKALGLLGMRERAALVSGELQIRGLPGKGTTVSLVVPLDQPKRSRGARSVAP